jgi:hypothetical protein
LDRATLLAYVFQDIEKTCGNCASQVRIQWAVSTSVA